MDHQCPTRATVYNFTIFAMTSQTALMERMKMTVNYTHALDCYLQMQTWYCMCVSWIHNNTVPDCLSSEEDEFVKNLQNLIMLHVQQSVYVNVWLVHVQIDSWIVFPKWHPNWKHLSLNSFDIKQTPSSILWSCQCWVLLIIIWKHCPHLVSSNSRGWYIYTYRYASIWLKLSRNCYFLG